MPPLQLLRPTPRLAALIALPCIGLAFIAPATALEPEATDATSTSSTSFSTASSQSSVQTQNDTQLTLASAGYVRPFKATSWWNTPLGAAPIDPYSRAYIRDSQKMAHTQNYLKLVLGDWGMPFYRALRSDPLYRINPSNGPTVTVHIPAHARQQPTSDASLTVVDPATHKAVGLSGARYDAGGHRWTATGASRYWLWSAGIEESLRGGTNGNRGHRGIPSPMQVVTKGEVLSGAINHRLALYWWETASSTPTGRDAYFPMSNSESGKNGIVPEGIVLRIKRSVDLKAKHLSPAALVVARALQKYGAVVGDNSGSGNNLKLQSNADWTRLLNKDSLRSIPWSDYVFVRGGYRP